MSIVENIFIVVFSVLWILACIVMWVLGILVIIEEIKEKKAKARNKFAQRDCGSCIFFLQRCAIGEAFDALREDSAKERDNELEENGATENDVGKEKWYVYGKTFDEIHGSVEESNVKRGPFDTSDEAEFYRDVLDEERTISGQHLYYDLYVDKEEVVEEVPESGGEE